MIRRKAKFLSAWGYQGDNMNLPVASVNDARPFYEKILGFKVADSDNDPQKRVTLERDGIKIGLVENGGDPTQDGCAFAVDSVEAAWDEFKANGLEKEISEFCIEEQDQETFKVFYVVAPDGLCYWFGERMSGSPE